MKKKELSVRDLEKIKNDFKKGTADCEPIINLISAAIYVNKSNLVNAYRNDFLEDSEYTNFMIVSASMTNDFLRHTWGEPQFIHKSNRIYNNYIIEHQGYDFIVSTEAKELMAPGININSLNGNLEMQKAVVSFILHFNQKLINFGNTHTSPKMKQFFERMKAKGIVEKVLRFDVDKFIDEHSNAIDMDLTTLKESSVPITENQKEQSKDNFIVSESNESSTNVIKLSRF